MPILRLAIPSPLRSLFDYLPPAHLSTQQLLSLQPGCRIRVTFGRREVTAVLVSIESSSEVPVDKLKCALEVLDPQPLPTPAMLELCDWASLYYHHPAGEVYASAFPASLRRGKAYLPIGEPGWELNQRGKGLPDGALPRSPKQARALELLQRSPAVSARQLIQEGISASIMRSLVGKNLVDRCVLEPSRYTPVCRPGLTPNTEQARAIAGIEPSLGHFKCHLLEGVTGSGKTEVYLQLIAACLKQNRQVLVLVPEIGLTPQTVARFQQRFEADIVSLHSGLAEGQRLAGWDAARTGLAHIIIGTRSSIFTPCKNLGLIVVDEEHDGSFKQQDGFRYSARDVAVKRGQLENCPVLLGSATPSLESIYNVNLGRYQLHTLSQRAGVAKLPALRAIDIRRQTLTAGFSDELVSAAANTLGKGKQVLLFLNRRGYAPTLLCHDCGWLAQCDHCDARLTVHRKRGQLRCHHCGHVRRTPVACPQCHSNRLLTAGLGTEQAEDYLRKRFPDTPLHRVDSDTMRRKNAMQTLSETIAIGAPCILLGTQMLTKGHHFPHVSLVAVIDADAALFSTDFRGEERMAQLLTQVGGRAGRADDPGVVYLQTHYPDHPAMRAVLEQPYGEHARNLLQQRIELGLPPASAMTIIRTDADRAETGEQFLLNLKAQVAANLPAGAQLIGPFPSPMQRRAGKFRSQLLLNAANRKLAQYATRLLVSAAGELHARGINWSIDIDPQDSF